MYRELDLRLTPEQEGLKEKAHRFAAKVLRPTAAALDRVADPSEVIAERSPFWRAFREAYRLGYHRYGIPAELRGLGLCGLEQHILFEELGWGSADLAIALAVAGFPFTVAAQSGSSDLIDRLVRPFVADGEARFIGCWAITEPEHGSDALMVGTPQFYDPRIAGEVIARYDRASWVLTGRKAPWVSNGTIATHALVFLTVDPGRGMAGGGVAIVPLHVRGVTRGKPLDKLGQRGLNQGEIVFDEVRIPESHMVMVPDPTRYGLILERTLALASAVMGAVFTGVARAAYEAALVYSQKRVQGGKPICEHQLVQKRLFDMFTRVEACRALSRTAFVYNHTTRRPATEVSIAAKTFCTEAALDVSSSALQLFGGNGLCRDNPIEKLFRDARASLIEDGSNDILALVGARQLLEAAAHPGGAVRGVA